MPSLRGRLIKLLLQNRHILKGQLRKKVVDWNQYEAILGFRREVEAGAERFGKVPSDIQISPVHMDGLYGEWLLPEGGEKDRVILYFHGGGYVCGTCRSHRSITSKFVAGSQIGALLFEYRLAPENPYPAGLEDALKAYRWLVAQGIRPEHIVFVGDSGGGGLLLGTLMALRDQGMTLPAAAVAYSPVTDLKCAGESHQTKAKVCLSPEGMALALAKHYAGERGYEIPYASPVYGEMHDLPPLLIYAGEDEILRDDAALFAAKAKEAGVDVTLRIGEGMFHCYPAVAPLFPEATEAMEEICRFIRRHLKAEMS